MRLNKMGVSLISLLAVLATWGWGAEVELVSSQTPWRAYLVMGPTVGRDKAGALTVSINRNQVAFDPAKFDPVKHPFSAMPPAGWAAAGFDDRVWPHYVPSDLADYLGGYGVDARGWGPARLCLRTSFGVANPGQAADLKVIVRCLGGGVVYVNGQEVGRGFMPEGEIAPLTPAIDYPPEAYTSEDGKMLPPVPGTGNPDPKLVNRYDTRIRTFEVAVPPRVLVKGRNVLAVELHPAPVIQSAGEVTWSHLGFHEVRVTSAGGAGAIPYAEAVKGTRVWSAEPLQQVTDTLPAKSPSKRSWFHALLWTRGMPVRGVQTGNPFDPVLPVRMLAPRNGVCSGQAVLSDPAGLRGVSAAIGDLKGPAGAVIPAGAVRICYAVQHASLQFCDPLMTKPPEGAGTVPVWLIVQVPKNRPSGWYVATLNLEANGRKFQVPVQVLVTGVSVPDARDFSSSVGMTQSPDTVAMQYKAAPWSDEFWKYEEKSLELLGQVGNDVVHVPVILGAMQATARDWIGSGSKGVRLSPLIRWEKTDGGGEKADFSLLEKYLDVYVKYCAPPRALCLYVWDAGCTTEVADAYEGRRIPTRTIAPKSTLLVLQWDPKTGTTSEAPAPAVGEEGSEQFWKPVFEGVRAIVVKRGWSERIVMAGLGGDLRPGQKTGELLRQWAPYVRWNILSHFSGDPGPVDGKLIATGGLEVGLKEHPWSQCGGAAPIVRLEEALAKPLDFLDIHTARWHHQECSPPLMFRTLPLLSGDITRLGLDFWLPGRDKPNNTSFFVHVNSLTVPGPDGALPTIRFQMLREGVQDVEVRKSIMQAYAKLPEEQRKPYRALLDEFCGRVGGAGFLSQCELAWDWPGYVARVHQAAAELAGIKTEAAWDRPPDDRTR